jgi:hypothetical protein
MVPIPPWVLLVHKRHLQWCSVCDPVKKKFTSKFSYFLFCNPTNKNETGIGKRLGTTNSKPPGPINHYDGGIQKHRRAVRSYLLHSFLQVHTFARPFTKPLQTVQLCGAKPAYFDFLSSNFNVHDPVLSPAWDGLEHTCQEENFTFQITKIVQKEKVTFFFF